MPWVDRQILMTTKEPFLIQIVPRTLFFSHISSYSGRFIMQLQLYWPHVWYKSTQRHPTCCSPHDTYRYHHFHCAKCAPHTPQRGTSTLGHSLPPLCSLPPLPFRHCCFKSACLSSEDASLNKPIHFFKRFLSFHYKKKEGGGQQWKSKGQHPQLSPRHMKSKEWVAVEWVSVCVHSFLIQS